MIKKIFKLTTIITFLILPVKANTNYFDEGVQLYNKKEFDKAKFKFEQDLVYNPKN